jgi:hypothetical protein
MNTYKECFICYSNGKTKEDIRYEQMINQKTINYPLLSMDYVYNCKCVNKYAHNICIININKCPTCRQKAKPNAYVYTKYDYYLKYLLNWLKKSPSNLSKLNWYMFFCLVIVILLVGFCSVYEEKIKNFKCIQYSLINFYFLGAISLFIFTPLYILFVFNDYLQKYWLYNKNTKKYDIFN